MSTWDTHGRCEARRNVRIGNQIEQDARCYLTPAHGTMHRAIVLDSDDRAIPYTWHDDEAAVVA